MMADVTREDVAGARKRVAGSTLPDWLADDVREKKITRAELAFAAGYLQATRDMRKETAP